MANPSILQEIPLIEKAYLQYMHNQFMRAAGTAGDTLLKNKNFATNQLKQSITGGAELQGSLIIGSFGANTAYAESIETGITKEKVTTENILEWAKRKIAIGHMEPMKNLKTFAMFTAKKINATGRLKSAKPYLQPAHAQLIRNLDADFPLEIN
jgi:hypothetical protein